MDAILEHSEQTSTDLRLEHFLPYRLSRLSNLVSDGIARTYVDRYQMSVTEWRVIAIVGRFPGIAAREVARKGALDKVAISRAVNRLIEAGFLERTMSTEDRRRSELRLSKFGDQVHREISPAALAYETKLLESLSSTEQSQLDHLLTKLWQRARILYDQPDPTDSI